MDHLVKVELLDEFLDVLEINKVALNLDTVPFEYGLSSIKKSLKKK
ncbi:MAG: hypothetical protein WCY27_03250 [archaeon]|nr:hypothetical protein [archaeon]MDD2477446.1 hypothetical protein [Candidatus ainarchaeum sp.]MDD3084696.1 hypothetical protein [Candidatus ainarchaeum sp.]MDD4220977.1 hypothetical protein [Candidatus ainarchaeum sp.]MDD4662452.1 hypothetical protein [Candidatus ainarchaeum sp.]